MILKLQNGFGESIVQKKPALEEFRNRYPQGSKEAQMFERFTSKFELAGVLIEYGFLNENLYFDRYGAVQTEWEEANG
jgi:hypothetical protein